jgi:hypothetical protein
VTNLEEKLIEVGNALARSMGHAMGRCPKSSPAVPCTCGAGAQQAQALEDWAHLIATNPPERGGFDTKNIKDGETVCRHGARPFECGMCMMGEKG